MASSTTAIEIIYCRQCRWLMRAAWMAQELLSTFEEELSGVTLEVFLTSGVAIFWTESRGTVMSCKNGCAWPNPLTANIAVKTKAKGQLADFPVKLFINKLLTQVVILQAIWGGRLRHPLV